MIIGAHLTTSKGLDLAILDALCINANTFQFFSRNPRGSRMRQYKEEEIKAFNQLKKQQKVGPIMAHAPYTMNLAGDDHVYHFAKKVLIEDLARMDKLGISYFNIHPGSHTGKGVLKAMNQVSVAINEGLNQPGEITLLLETMSGRGTEIGYQFEHLKELIGMTQNKSRIGVCMDLCHVFNAGYDIKGNLRKVLREFDQVVGLDYLKAIHLNDSKTPLGAKKDQHASIGKGEIGMEAIVRIVTHPYLRNLPFYLETPVSLEEHRQEIWQLRKQCKDRRSFHHKVRDSL